MKLNIKSTVAVLAAVMLLGSITAATLLKQEASANLQNYKEFKELTNDFEKDVLDAATVNPSLIPGLLEDYSRNVLELFPSTSPSP
jgi:hypothetical protein